MINIISVNGLQKISAGLYTRVCTFNIIYYDPDGHGMTQMLFHLCSRLILHSAFCFILIYQDDMLAACPPHDTPSLGGMPASWYTVTGRHARLMINLTVKCSPWMVFIFAFFMRKIIPCFLRWFAYQKWITKKILSIILWVVAAGMVYMCSTFISCLCIFFYQPIGTIQIRILLQTCVFPCSNCGERGWRRAGGAGLLSPVRRPSGGVHAATAGGYRARPAAGAAEEGGREAGSHMVAVFP